MLSQCLGVVPGEGEELLNHFPWIFFPQRKGMEEQVLGMGGWVLSLSPPHSDSAKTASIRPKTEQFAPKKTKKRLKNLEFPPKIRGRKR